MFASAPPSPYQAPTFTTLPAWIVHPRPDLYRKEDIKSRPSTSKGTIIAADRHCSVTWTAEAEQKSQSQPQLGWGGLEHEEAEFSRTWSGGRRTPGELVGKAGQRKPRPRPTKEDKRRRSQVGMRVDGSGFLRCGALGGWDFNVVVGLHCWFILHLCSSEDFASSRTYLQRRRSSEQVGLGWVDITHFIWLQKKPILGIRTMLHRLGSHNPFSPKEKEKIPELSKLM